MKRFRNLKWEILTIFSELDASSFVVPSDGGGSTDGTTVRSDSPAPAAPSTSQEETEKPPDPELEKRLLGYLSDLSLTLPTDSLSITNELNSVSFCLRCSCYPWTQWCGFIFDISVLFASRHSQKQPLVTAASRACCLNSLLRSSSRSESPPRLLLLLQLPPPHQPPRWS